MKARADTVSQHQKRENSHTAEFILGLTGGSIGFFAGIFAIGIGDLGGVWAIQGASIAVLGGFGAVLFSLLGIIAAVMVKSRTKFAGYLMLISAMGGLFCIFIAYAISFVLLFLAGIIALRHARDERSA